MALEVDRHVTGEQRFGSMLLVARMRQKIEMITENRWSRSVLWLNKPYKAPGASVTEKNHSVDRIHRMNAAQIENRNFIQQGFSVTDWILPDFFLNARLLLYLLPRRVTKELLLNRWFESLLQRCMRPIHPSSPMFYRWQESNLFVFQSTDTEVHNLVQINIRKRG